MQKIVFFFSWRILIIFLIWPDYDFNSCKTKNTLLWIGQLEFYIDFY